MEPVHDEQALEDPMPVDVRSAHRKVFEQLKALLERGGR